MHHSSRRLNSGKTHAENYHLYGIPLNNYWPEDMKPDTKNKKSMPLPSRGGIEAANDRYHKRHRTPDHYLCLACLGYGGRWLPVPRYMWHACNTCFTKGITAIPEAELGLGI